MNPLNAPGPPRHFQHFVPVRCHHLTHRLIALILTAFYLRL